MQTISYNITTEVPSSYLQTLLDFIYVQYLFPQNKKFSDFSRKIVNGIPSLSYTVLNEQNQKPILNVIINAKIPLQINIQQINDEPSSKIVELTKQDIIIAIQMFEEKTRRRTLYFAWSEGEKIIPETLRKKEKSFKRLFLETQILFFIVFITLGMAVFLVITTFFPEILWIAPIALISVQFIFVFYSSNIISRNSDWTITKKNPYIHILTYHLPLEKKDNFNQILSLKKKMQIKKDIYTKILSQKSEIDCISANKIFLENNISCSPENLQSKKINVYNLVSRIANRFNFPIPKIVVSNTMIPNAATSGPSPSRGLVLITTGLLVQLDEKEIISVIGHEFGHLKGRDPLILYGLTSAEFLFRFYVLFPFFPFISLSFLFIAYFWIVMVIIFFIGKFLEARADLASAQEIGNPKILAGALEKIGFQRLLYERASTFRISEWLGLDPHPPIYFRVKRLKTLDPNKKIDNRLIQSIKDVIRGFLDTLKTI
jgi:heat shock protein HtpX